MASTVTPDNRPFVGKADPAAFFLRHGSFHLGASYATNGIAVTPAQFGLLEIAHLDCGTAGGIVFEYDKTNGKVKAFQQSAATGALTEVPNATDLSAKVGALPRPRPVTMTDQSTITRRLVVTVEEQDGRKAYEFDVPPTGAGGAVSVAIYGGVALNSAGNPSSSTPRRFDAAKLVSIKFKKET